MASLEDLGDDPERFVERAIDAKIAELGARAVAAPSAGERARLAEIREAFLRLKDGYSRRGGPSPKDPSPTSPSPVSADSGSSIRTDPSPSAPASASSQSGLGSVPIPMGVIPGYRRYGTSPEGEGRAGSPSPGSVRTPPAAATSPAASSPVSPPAGGGPGGAASSGVVRGKGIAAMLQSMQASKGAAAEDPQPPEEASQPTVPTAPVVSNKGSMLSFLEKMRTEGPGGKGGGGPKDDDGGDERKSIRRKVLDSLKVRASSKGFDDLYELLKYKKERLEESLGEMRKKRGQENVVRIIEMELSEVNRLLGCTQEEILKVMDGMEEILEVDKGGLRALKKEIAGLLEEIS